LRKFLLFSASVE